MESWRQLLQAGATAIYEQNPQLDKRRFERQGLAIVGVKDFGGYDLTAFHQPVFIRAIISDSAMHRAKEVPQQDVSLGPGVEIAEAILKLVEQEV